MLHLYRIHKITSRMTFYILPQSDTIFTVFYPIKYLIVLYENFMK